MDEPAIWAADEDEDTEDADSEGGALVLDLTLYNAAKDGDPAGVEEALRDGSDLELRVGYYQETALHAACERGDLVIIRMLLDAGARVNSRDRPRATPLHIACMNDDLEIVRELIRRGADICAKDSNGDTPFDWCTSIGNPVEECLLRHFREKYFEREGRNSFLKLLQESTNRGQSGADLPIGRLEADQLVFILRFFLVQDPGSIRAQNRYGELPIHIACTRLLRLSVIQFIVEQDPSTLHISNNDGSLPIHLACRAGASLPVVKYLVGDSYPESVRARDGYGNLPVHIACVNCGASFEVFQYLVEQDATTLHISNSNGALPIHVVCQGGCSTLQVVKYLLEDNDPGFILARNSDGDLPLHVACGNRRAPLEFIQYLLEQDAATLHFPNNNGALPIHVACHVAVLPILKFLVEEIGGAATLCARDNDGALPLHTVCQFCGGFALKAVEYLVKCYPAALLARTHSGDLPITLACASGSLDLIYTLVRGDPEVVGS